jgi:6-phosphogluconolactonase
MHHRVSLRRVLRRLVFALCAWSTSSMSSAATYVYVSNADSREISVLSLELASGALEPVQTVGVEGQVMPLAVSPDRRFLYAALRSQPYTVASFAIAPGGKLQPIGRSPLPESMAHITTDRSGRHLFAASYGGHQLSVSPIGADGVVGAPAQVLPTGRNAHASLTDPGNRYLFVTNLGSDAVMQWRLDAAAGRLAPNEPPAFDARPKTGPRHLVFHPNGRFVMLLNELDASVDVLAFDRERGTLAQVQTLSTLPPGFAGKPWAADLHFTPDGRFLYTSERTSSTLAAFEVDGATGRLTLLGHTPTEQQPRSFQVDPSGRYLVVAGQASHAVLVHRIDPQSGQLRTLSSTPLGLNPSWVEIVSLP